MSDINTKVGFNILIDESFINEDGVPCDKENVLSIVNDFEDGSWRYSKFNSFILNNIAETALSQTERDSLIDQPHDLMKEASKNLRLTDKDDDISKGSELAEIVLYGIMKHHYKALSLVPKIFYKQNPQDNAKGADSVHIVVNESKDDFSLWFGEAKFYNSIENARLGSIIDSVKKSLKTDKLKKENSIITNVSDIESVVEDENLRAEIKNALSPKASIDDIKPKLNIPILLLHECDITGGTTEMSEEYCQSIVEYHNERATSYFNKQREKLSGEINMYSSITFHVIVFPVPNKDQVTNNFISNVEHFKSQ